MKTFLIAFLLVGSQLQAAIPTEHIIRAWRLGDGAAISAIRDTDYWNLSAEDLTTLIPELARWIPIHDLLLAHPDQSWKSFKSEHDWTPFLSDLPLTHPIRHRWELSSSAAWILRVLSERRLVQDHTILPVLIEGVSHPSASFTGRDCFYALTALTKLYDGPLTSWGNLDLSSHPVELQNWFRRWLAANGGKNLIVTRDLEAKIKFLFLRVAKAVEVGASGQEHALHGFSAPDEKIYHRVGEPLFSTAWDGRNLSSFEERHGQGSVFICVRSASSLVTTIAPWNKSPSWDILKSAESHGDRIYQRAIANTDWVVEVYCKRLSHDEARGLSDTLDKIDFK